MALSGYFSTNKYNGVIGLYFSWTGTQDVANNTTTIRWNLYSSGGSSGQWWYAGPITVTIGGKSVYSQTSRFKLYGDTAYHKSGTTVITHDENGERSVAMSVKAAIYSTSVNCTGSKTFALNKIDRYALVSLASDFNDEGTPSMDYVNPAGVDMVTNLRGRLSWTDGVNAYATDYVTLNDEGGSYSFDLDIVPTGETDSARTLMQNACPNSNILTVTYEVSSDLNGSTYTNSRNATMSIINANPTSGTVSYEDTDGATTAITGNDQIIVQKQSTLVISTASSSGKKGASITGYSLEFNGISYPSVSSGVLLTLVKPDISGDMVATVTTTDSRGNTVQSSITIPITAWQTPTAEATLGRVNGFETNTILNVKANISTVTGSSLAITEKHKALPNGSWSSPTSVPDNDDVTLSLDNTKEWQVEVSVSDAFETVTYLLSVGKGIPIAFIDKDMHSIGFNAFPTEDDGVYFGGNFKALIETNTTIANCLTKAGGNSNVSSVSFERTCMNNQLTATLRTTAAVASGANVWSGYLGDAISSHTPNYQVYGSGMSNYNSEIVTVFISAGGVVTIRNTSPRQIPSGYNVSLSISWISN